MTLTLLKGQKLDLTKHDRSLQLVRVGLGWDPVESKSGLFGFMKQPNIDIDASVIMLRDGRLSLLRANGIGVRQYFAYGR